MWYQNMPLETYYPMPTVEELVKVFCDNNWTPTPRNGSEPEYVQRGECCAIPALIKLHGDLPRDFDSVILVEIVKKKYGPGAQDIWRGFDGDFTVTSANGFMLEASRAWIKLGAQLREALGVTTNAA
jgi:hypothetical protein